MTPADRRASTARLLHTASAGAGTALTAFAAAGHGTIACITLATAVAIPGLATLAREWFWHSALLRPARNLNRIHQLTHGRKRDAERLFRLVQEGEKNVLTARAAASGRTGKHQAS